MTDTKKPDTEKADKPKVEKPEIVETHKVGADTYFLDVDGNRWVERG